MQDPGRSDRCRLSARWWILPVGSWHLGQVEVKCARWWILPGGSWHLGQVQVKCQMVDPTFKILTPGEDAGDLPVGGSYLLDPGTWNRCR